MIELKNVWKSYGSGYCAFSCKQLTIHKGEIVGVLGENGSGKTTMLKAVMGLTEIQSGEILIDERPAIDRYDLMSFITEEGSFFLNQTPYDYGEFLAEFFPRFDKERYRKFLTFFELSPYQKIKSFSKGQKSKLEICAGFSKGAKYLLLDEPFLGNDMHTRKDFLKLMVSNLTGDETIMMTTHFIHEIENVIDRAIILRNGLVKVDAYIDDMRDEGKDLVSLMAEVTGYQGDEYRRIYLEHD